MFSLKGQKALVVGIANEHSIAYGCAKAFKEQGAELAITYLNDKAKPYVEPLAKELDAAIFEQMNVEDNDSVDRLFKEIESKWGEIDILLHAVAFCPAEDLHARVIDTSSAGFATAMDISVHSFLRLIHKAEPMMKPGSTCLTVSYQGAERVVNHYNIMGPVKAALEATVRYAARELGEKQISVHALSPGPLMTRASSGIASFDELINNAIAKSPTHKLATIEDVGAYAAFLASPNARNLTGNVHTIDGGLSIVA